MAREQMNDLDEANELDRQPHEKKKPPLMKWIIVVFITLVIIIGAAAGAYYYFNKAASTAKKAAQQTQPVIGTVYPLDPFIINLQDNNGERYLKIVMQLEISDPNGVKELDMLKPKIRDNILDLLSAKTYRELMDAGGKQRLRDEIVMRLNSIVATAKISRVYLTEFVVQ